MSLGSVKIRLRESGVGSGFSPAAVTAAMAQAVRWTESRWRQLAAKELRSSLSDYLAGMSVYSRGTKLYLHLAGRRRGKRDFSLPVARELGQESFDLRQGFLTASKRVSRHRSGTLPRFGRTIPLDPGFARNRPPFATITATADKASWKHPGMKAAHLMDEVVESVKQDIAPVIIGDLLKGLEL
jgi:hypothetical protein